MQVALPVHALPLQRQVPVLQLWGAAQAVAQQ
jgi:hypothetical protein